MQIKELLSDIKYEVNATIETNEFGGLPHEVFLEWCIEKLTELNEAEDLVAATYEQTGQLVHGYSYSDHDGRLDLYGTIYRGSTEEYTLYKSDAEATINRLKNFYLKYENQKINTIDIEHPIYDLVEIIQKSEITLVRLFLFTDGRSTINRIEDYKINDTNIQTHIWDITRFFRFHSSQDYFEDTDVIFSEYGHQSIPCSSTDTGLQDIKTYLCVVSGDLLADIYMNYTSRLLERNVRSFLSFKSKINRGILRTIQEEPDKFIAYNNGLTATASTIQLDGTKTKILEINGFQIVNGGQTTNAIYRAKYSNKIDVSNVYVPMKLCVLDENLMDEFGSNISKFANTQNVIRRTDLTSNHPIFQEIQVLSRNTPAPTRRGEQVETKWYFERTRGQYMDEVSMHQTASRKKKFELQYPRSQKFDKSKLIKYWGIWYQQVQDVSLGIEKYMPIFIEDLKNNKNKFDPSQPSESYKKLIGMAIVYEHTVKQVRRKKYGDSYPSHVVNYTIALISNLCEMKFDLFQVWNNQLVPDEFVKNVDYVAPIVRDTIRKVASEEHVMARELAYGRRIRGESLWDLLQAQNLTLPEKFKFSRSGGNAPTINPNSSREPLTTIDEEKINKVREIGYGKLWAVTIWAKETDNLQSWQRGIIGSVAQRLQQNQLPSVKQSIQTLKGVQDAEKLGFKYSVE